MPHGRYTRQVQERMDAMEKRHKEDREAAIAQLNAAGSKVPRSRFQKCARRMFVNRRQLNAAANKTGWVHTDAFRHSMPRFHDSPMATAALLLCSLVPPTHLYY